MPLGWFRKRGRKNSQARRYDYGGQNNLWLDNYLGARCVRLSLYYPEGLSTRLFYETENGISEEDLIKLLYIVESGKEIRDSGFDEHKLKSIPWLAECGILHYEGSRPVSGVPALYGEDAHILNILLERAQAELAKVLINPLKDFLRGKRKQIPGHLKSVPLQKQYLYSDHAMLMLTLELAMERGLLRAGGVRGETWQPCPIILAVNE